MKKRCHLCSTRTRQASQVFPNTDNHLLSGSTGSIVISNEMKQVIVIPQSATYEIQNKTYAWRIVDGRSTSGRLLPTGRKKAESKIITVLPTSDGKNYVVTSDLAVGDVIVAKGAGYVKEGQEIEVRP